MPDRAGPSAVCLECWKEGVGFRSPPIGYYNVPCERHGVRLLEDFPICVIKETDIDG